MMHHATGNHRTRPATDGDFDHARDLRAAAVNRCPGLVAGYGLALLALWAATFSAAGRYDIVRGDDCAALPTALSAPAGWLANEHDPTAATYGCTVVAVERAMPIEVSER